MIQTRGIALVATRAFVRERYGPDAHDRVLQLLPPELAAPFDDLREGGWKPLRALSAYVEASRRLFAPDDDGYYVRLGFHVGQVERKQGGFGAMVATPAVAMRMAPLVWKALYDAGRLEFEAEGPGQGVARLYGFVFNPIACGTTRGAIQGLATAEDTEQGRAAVEEIACRAAGGDHCAFRLRWP